MIHSFGKEVELPDSSLESLTQAIQDLDIEHEVRAVLVFCEGRKRFLLMRPEAIDWSWLEEKEGPPP